MQMPEVQTMRLYIAVASATARRMATYRGATFAGVFTNTVFGFVLAYVLLAVFRARGDIGGFDATDAVTFTFVTQGMLMVVGIFGDREQSERIHSGEVATDLVRPYDYQAWWAASAYGKAAFYLLFRGVPPFVVGALAFHLRLPAAPGVWVAFATSVALAVAVTFAYRFLVELSAFWLVDNRGLQQFAWLSAQLLSGTVVPLVLVPDGLEPLVRALPFAAMVNAPVEVFLGKHRGLDLLAVYAGQAAWVVVLAGAGRLLLRRATRRLEVQGG